MGQRDMWKALHLLHVYGSPGLSQAQLERAGVDCYNDTIDPLIHDGALERRPIEGRKTDQLFLSRAAGSVLQNCFVSNRGFIGGDIYVDAPSAFVVMPFSEPWSDDVFSEIIEPAVDKVGLECIRGDTIVRVGDLNCNVWGQLMRCGVVVAEVTAPNVNVFYELGLAHALGKDVLLLKEREADLPADFGGAHYYEYSRRATKSGSALLAKALRQWMRDRSVNGVKRLAAR